MSFPWLFKPRNNAPERTKETSQEPAHEAARSGSRLRGWFPSRRGPQREAASAPVVRDRVRDAIRNNPIATAALDILDTYVIGDGISVKPLVRDPVLREQLIDDWEEWAEYCDYDGVTDWYGMLSRVHRAWKQDGESYIRLIPTDDPIPLRLQIIEADHVPFKSRQLDGGHRIVDGAELDARGRLVAWWVCPRHPGDESLASNDPIRVPVSEILHIYKPKRPGQLRAASEFVSTLVRMKVLDDWDDVQLERQRTANLFLGFIRKPSADPLLERDGDGEEPPPEEEEPPLGFEPNTLQELAPGEEMQFSDPPGASEGYKDFSRAQLRRISSALGIPYPLMTGDFDELNDRVVRVAMGAFKRRSLQEINHVMVPQMCRPVRRAFASALVLARRVDDPAPVCRVRWTAAAWPYIHPVQDVQATGLEIKHGLKSRSEAVLERGYDAETQDQEFADDKEREEHLGLSFGDKSTDAGTDTTSATGDDPEEPAEYEKPKRKHWNA